MKTWIIEPRDPLIVKDGRPFGTTPGARATSLSFPFPSTITGGVRTRDGSTVGPFDSANIMRVKQLEVRGPLLVQLDQATGQIADWLLPAPADALVLHSDSADKVKISLLVPFKPGRNVTNLKEPLDPVGLAHHNPNEPLDDPPRFWAWKHFQQWLLDPRDYEEFGDQLGIQGPVREQRTHVSIEPTSQTNVEGELFQTRGLEFTGPGRWGSAQRLALALATDAPNLTDHMSPLAGERRLVWWRESRQPALDLLSTACPDNLQTRIKADGYCRVLLLTPAHFKNGSRPDWLISPRHGVDVALKAIALKHAQVVSGWDFETPRPKPTRRLAPAGTVLFLKLNGSQSAIADWIANTWLRCVSDDPQDRLDGFGLAATGVWDGDSKEIE